jgi:hypothetical protein
MKQAFRHLDMDSIIARVNSFSVNLQDYELITPTLAKVLITYSGTSPIKEEVRASIAKLFGQQASPVTHSFRSLERTGGSKCLAGFIRYQSDVKEFDETAADNQGRYKQMASNLLMDNEDKSMWEVKSGSTGKYLVRKGEEDLSELVHLAHAKKSGHPTLAQIAKVPAEVREFAAYVDLKNEEVMHGYVVAKTDQKMTVVAFDGEGEPEDINTDQLVEVVSLDGEDEQEMGRKMSTAAVNDREAMVRYYKQAYNYSPDYINMLIEMIDQHSFA